MSYLLSSTRMSSFQLFMKTAVLFLTLSMLYKVFTISRQEDYYGRGASPSESQQKLFDLLLDRKYDFGQCPNKCVLDYFDKVLQQFRGVQMPSDRINLLFQDSFDLMCNPELFKSLPIYRDKKLIMVTGPGSSGTSTAYALLGILGYQSLHWNHVLLRNNSGAVYLHEQFIPYLRKHVDPNTRYASRHDYHHILCNRSVETLMPFFNLFKHMDAIADSPVSQLWFELTHVFPDFKLLFTDRAGDWAHKRKTHSKGLDVPFAAKLCGRRMVVGEFDEAFTQSMLQHFRDLQHCMVPKDRFHAIDLKQESMKPDDKHDGFWSSLITFVGLEKSINKVLMNNSCHLIEHRGMYGVGDKCADALCAVSHRHCPSPRASPIAEFPETTYYL